MTERLIDAVCPHCGRVGTTVRVVLHEDGYTKLSRRCTDCGGECIHTFDHDWLAVAKNKKLQADNERLLQAVGLATTAVPDMHVDIENPVGMMQRVVAEVERLRAEIERLKLEPELLRAELISLANAARKALADAYDRAREGKP